MTLNFKHLLNKTKIRVSSPLSLLLLLVSLIINVPLFDKSILFSLANDPSLAAHPSHGSIKQQKVERIEMARHSFESPLTLDTTLGEWDLAMATIPVKKSVVLVPGVKNRTGQFWNKGLLSTSKFEIYITFEVVNMSPEVKQEGEGFALWFVSESYGSIYPKSGEDLANWNLLGYKNNPKGIGVLFSFLDRNNKKNPSVSLLTSDGSKTFSSQTDIPTHVGVYFNFANLEEPLTFRLHVSPEEGITGQIRTSATSKWINCFKADPSSIPEPVKNGGFIGFTSYTGSEANEHSKIADRISIISVHTYNLDLNRAGEEVADSLKYESGHDKEHVEITDLLRETHVHGDKDVSEALKAFSQILYKHITEATPREQAIHRTLNTLLSQVQKLSNEVKEMQRILTIIHTGNNHSETLSSVQTEIVGLKTLLDRHSKHHTNSIIELEGTIKSKEDVVTQVQKAIKSQYSTSSIASIVLVVTIVIFGLVVWKKVRDIEKKHLL